MGDQKVESQENIHRRARKERREKILIGWLRQKSHIGHKKTENYVGFAGDGQI